MIITLLYALLVIFRLSLILSFISTQSFEFDSMLSWLPLLLVNIFGEALCSTIPLQTDFKYKNVFLAAPNLQQCFLFQNLFVWGDAVRGSVWRITLTFIIKCRKWTYR